MPVIIGIDIGTTHTKGIVVNESGLVLHQQKDGYDTLHPQNGFAEQDSLELLNAVTGIIKHCLEAAGTETIAAISFSCAMHGLMAVDKEGKPLTNLIIWSDNRSAAHAAAINNSAEAGEVFQQTGTPIHPMSPLCKIKWLRENEPALFADSYKFIGFKEFLFYTLFGEYVVDYSIASATGLFNAGSLQWSQLALSIVGINAQQLSTPVAITQSFTKLLPQYQNYFQLQTNLPFIIGGSDGCLANLGTGAVNEKDTCVTIGTSGAVRTTLFARIMDDKRSLFNYFTSDKMFVSGGPISNGGIVVKWLQENVFKQPFASATDFEKLLTATAAIEAGAEGLIFLPYLQGERAPVWDAQARGALVGLQLQHTQTHIAKAVLEALAFSLYDILNAIEILQGTIDTVYASGGFFSADGWWQLLSNVTGKKIQMSSVADASAMGAVFVGMYACGLISNWQQIKSFTAITHSYLPDAALHQQYKKIFAIYQSIYQNLQTNFKELNAL